MKKVLGFEKHVLVRLSARAIYTDVGELILHNTIVYILCKYSQTSLVSTPGHGDPPNCYSLSVVLANHID